ncbi:MAG: DNA-packaging protein [Alphaproteobacteria bacterium]|nr:DNA-packaging protein [Alphaproteobacteria bacterium]
MLSLPEAKLRKAINEYDADRIRWLLDEWSFWARDEQRPPPGPWRIWLFLGGRGSGKTRAGAEWVAAGIRAGAMRRVALIGATFADVRSVMIEGVAGLLAVSPGAQYEPSNARVKWPGSGAIAHVLSAEEPDSIRGHQFDAAWCDEFCKWKDPQGALDMALMALRIGADPRLAITTTPRAIPALKDLLSAPDVAVTRGKTRDNIANLAPGFYDTMQARFGGTRLGRQELDAELIEDNDRALWQRGWIEAARVREAPPLMRIVVALDPPATAHGDECGIVVAGISEEAHAYVLADRSAAGLSPAGWAARVLDAYEEFSADVIVAEANQGGDMVKAVLTQELETAPVKLVHATRDKRTRAAPAAALYERGVVHHVGAFAELEDQLCQYDGSGSSPDRLDALVWALADLFPQKRRALPKVRRL